MGDAGDFFSTRTVSGLNPFGPQMCPAHSVLFIDYLFFIACLVTSGRREF